MALQQVAKYEKQEEFFSAIREVYELDVSSVDIRNAGWKADVIVEDAIWTAMHLEL